MNFGLSLVMAANSNTNIDSHSPGVTTNEKYRSTLLSFALISPLPATNMDLWGLIVLALANGADENFEESANGGFCASLDGRDFVLTLRRESLLTPIFGHLEPRQHPEKGHRSLKEPEWTSLLEDGTTFDKSDSWITWALQDGDPHPSLSGKLRTSFAGLYMTVMTFGRTLKGTTGEEQDQEIKKIKDQAQEVQKNILRKKLILHDRSSHNEYLQEHTHHDTLEHAIKQLEYTQRDLGCDQSWLRNKNGKKRRDKLYQKMEELKRKRLLTLPNILDESPSTRDAGIRVALT
ncbi:hypothetical protein DPV78_007998 [Talaromyces pinophilus]|nr:hypothetical protein DPV78_007998 [Talaromyces pinophilus]